MSDTTLQSLTFDLPHLAPVAEEAAQQGIQVGRLLGAGGYGAVFEAISPGWGECVLKVAGVEFAGPKDILDGEHGPYRDSLPHSLYGISGPSATGPRLPSAPASLEQAGSLLEDACRRQQDQGAEWPLARLFAVLRLGGRPAALFERLHGRSLRSLLADAREKAQATVPVLVRALTLLHDTFGAHGDLKPDHVFVDDGRVVFIDPLPEKSGWIGSLGYALPFMYYEMDNGRLKDLGSLAAMLAELWGGSVGWDKPLARCMANLNNDRFSCREFELTHVLDRMRDGTAAVPLPMQSWILDIGQAFLDYWTIADAAPRRDPGWCRGQLEALALRFGATELPEGRT
jgi:hypothetical protein